MIRELAHIVGEYVEDRTIVSSSVLYDIDDDGKEIINGIKFTFKNSMVKMEYSISDIPYMFDKKNEHCCKLPSDWMLFITTKEYNMRFNDIDGFTEIHSLNGYITFYLNRYSFNSSGTSEITIKSEYCVNAFDNLRKEFEKMENAIKEKQQ